MLFEMMNMPVVTSQYWNIAYGRAPGEVAQDTEGMQTIFQGKPQVMRALLQLGCHYDESSGQKAFNNSVNRARISARMERQSFRFPSKLSDTALRQ